MKLSNREYDSLFKFMKTLTFQQLAAKYRYEAFRLDPEGQGKDLQDLDQSTLQQFVNILPSGAMAKVTSPILKKVRSKFKDALKFVRRPHLDPESWPKVFRRNTKISNARAGIFEGPGGMLMRLHDQAMAVQLNTTHVWDERNAGDLIIMGRWYQISAAIGRARGAVHLKSELKGTQGDVNIEFDKKYGPMPGDAPGGLDRLDHMPFYVSCQGGQQFHCTDSQGEVVADPRTEIVKLVGGKIAGVAGNFNVVGPQWASDARTGLDVIALGKDVFDKARDALSSDTETITDNTIYTVVVGTSPATRNYVATDSTSLEWDALLYHTLTAMEQA